MPAADRQNVLGRLGPTIGPLVRLARGAFTLALALAPGVASAQGPDPCDACLARCPRRVGPLGTPEIDPDCSFKCLNTVCLDPTAPRPRPSPGPSDPEIAARLEGLRTYLEQQVAAGAFPGGVVLVGYRQQVVYLSPFGHYGADDPRPVEETTIYDLASLTKVVALTTAVMLLVAQGRLDLDARVADYVPAFRLRGSGRESPGARGDVRLRHLLTHTSGLPAGLPRLHLRTQTREEALEEVNTAPLIASPGTRCVYSDLGIIVLTEVVEAVTRQPLDRLLTDQVFTPLGMHDTRFRPPPGLRFRIAPTERDPWRGRVLRGEVHDEIAARLAGVSGHAGLFSTAPDLARFAFWLLDAYHGRLPPSAPPRVPADLVREFTRQQPGPSGCRRALGWETRAPDGRSSAGSRLSPSSFGHTGFTGTSIWIDPERELVIVLLTNRVHPTRENQAIVRVRPIVADRVVAALEDRR